MRANMDGNASEHSPLVVDEALDDQQDLLGLSCPPNPYSNLPVYNTIHRVRAYVIASLDDPYSLDQLRAPRINVSVVRPLVNKLWDIRDVSIIYCLLVNKLQFLREQGFQAHQTVHTTRAMLCELVAMKILRRFDEETLGNQGLLLLSNALVAGFKPFQNAPPDVVRESTHAYSTANQKGRGYNHRSTALEVAILCDSKLLIASPAFQKVMEAIYVGRIVYTPSSFIDILPDHYKQKPITLYRPEHAPVLNQYRLMVPRTRNMLDIIQFLFLLLLYILVMQNRDYHSFTAYEFIFCIYASGWVLDEFASIVEHGWHCYTQNLWSFLDAISAIIIVVYLVLRMHSLADRENRHHIATASLDILSAAAPVLIPRLAFNLLSENMLFVSLRAMMANFIVLTLLAIWCFGGFLLSLAWLSGDTEDNLTISKWMLYVWFGLGGTGIDESVNFHRIIGPILMVTFAFLGNTLFLTILVSMLNHTFAAIASNATAEIQFRRAVLTFEGVKSDAIFCYMPPFNVLALLFFLPLKLVVTPRWFHKVNVAVIRTLNAPLLLLITVFERRHLWSSSQSGGLGTASARKLLNISTWIFEFAAWWDFSRFSVHGDIEAVFDFDPPSAISSPTPSSPTLDERVGSKNGPVLGASEFLSKQQQRTGRKETAEAPAPTSPSKETDAAASIPRPAPGPPTTLTQPPPRRKSLAFPLKRSATATVVPSASSGVGGGRVGDTSGGTASSSSIRRRESMGTMSGLADHVADFLHEHGAGEMNDRFKALEAGQRRIEVMLRRVWEGMGEDDSSSEEDAPPPEAGLPGGEKQSGEGHPPGRAEAQRGEGG